MLDSFLSKSDILTLGMVLPSAGSIPLAGSKCLLEFQAPQTIYFFLVDTCFSHAALFLKIAYLAPGAMGQSHNDNEMRGP